MKEMNAHRVTITMRDGSVFHGYINIGSCRRLSDFFEKSDSSPFVVMFETTIGESKEKNVYFINRWTSRVLFDSYTFLPASSPSPRRYSLICIAKSIANG